MSGAQFTTQAQARVLPGPEALGVKAGYVEYPDAKTPGLRVRVGRAAKDGSVARTYVLRAKIKDARGRVTEHRPTIGSVTGVTLEAARQAAVKTLQDLRSAARAPSVAEAAGAAERFTLGDAWFLQCETHRAAVKRATTISKERSIWDRYYAQYAERPLAGLDETFWINFADGLRNVDGTRPRAATLDGVMALATSMWNRARDRRKLPAHCVVNPVSYARAEVVQSAHVRTTFVQPSCVGALWRAAGVLIAPWARDHLYLYLLTGLRNSLLTKLRFDEINFETAVLSINPAKRGAKKRAKGAAEDAPPLTIPLSPWAVEILSARREFAPDPAGLVWYRAPHPGRTEPAPHSDARAAFDLVQPHAGVTFTPHVLRRTFAVLLALVNTQPADIAALLMHNKSTLASLGSVGEVTLRYIGWLPVERRIRAKLLERDAYLRDLISGVRTGEFGELVPEVEEAVGREDQ